MVLVVDEQISVAGAAPARLGEYHDLCVWFAAVGVYGESGDSRREIRRVGFIDEMATLEDIEKVIVCKEVIDDAVGLFAIAHGKNAGFSVHYSIHCIIDDERRVLHPNRVGGFSEDASLAFTGIDAVAAVLASAHDPAGMDNVFSCLIHTNDDPAARIWVLLQRFEIGLSFFNRIHVCLPFFLSSNYADFNDLLFWCQWSLYGDIRATLYI